MPLHVAQGHTGRSLTSAIIDADGTGCFVLTMPENTSDVGSCNIQPLVNNQCWWMAMGLTHGDLLRISVSALLKPAEESAIIANESDGSHDEGNL